MAEIRHFHSKVVGVTHDNDDGTNRQAIARRCRPMEQLILILVGGPDATADDAKAYLRTLGRSTSTRAPILGHRDSETPIPWLVMAGIVLLVVAYLAC